jgi:hypothetical protein
VRIASSDSLSALLCPMSRSLVLPRLFVPMLPLPRKSILALRFLSFFLRVFAFFVTRPLVSHFRFGFKKFLPCLWGSKKGAVSALETS